MQIVINSSPLIFLTKLNYLHQFLDYPDSFYIPKSSLKSLGRLPFIEIDFRVKRSIFNQTFLDD